MAGMAPEGRPPPQLTAALARLRAVTTAGPSEEEEEEAEGGAGGGAHACDGGGEFGCAACTGVAEAVGDRLAAYIAHGPGERAEFWEAGGAEVLTVRSSSSFFSWDGRGHAFFVSCALQKI